MSSDFLAALTPEELASLTDVPVTQPPDGQVPDLDNPVQYDQPFFVVTSILLVVSFLLFLNRSYCKIFIVRKLTWDDCKFAGLGWTSSPLTNR